MAYNPADLRLPSWLLRVLDALIRIEMPLAPAWRIGMTRPGVLLAGVLIGLWLAAFYSGNNLLYLCGAMLSALVLASIWQGVQLLKSVPLLAEFIPSATEAGDSYALHMPMPSDAARIGMVDVQWFGDKQEVPLQMRLEGSARLTGRLRADMRALIHLDRQRLTTAAPLGVWKISRWRDESRAWAVLPRAVAWAESISGNSQLSRPCEGDELRDLRSYVPGVPCRESTGVKLHQRLLTGQSNVLNSMRRKLTQEKSGLICVCRIRLEPNCLRPCWGGHGTG